jgi:hypothetical protein
METMNPSRGLNRKSVNQNRIYARPGSALVLIAGLLIGCGSGGGAADSSPAVSPSPGPTPTAQSVVVKSGRGFECFALGGSVWCRGSGGNSDIGLTDPTNFVEFLADGDSSVTNLETWDDTICATTVVTQRPYSNTPGVATYCVGEANLGGAIGAFPAIYSGPNFTPGVHDSPDLVFHATPMMGGDFPMVDLVNSSFMTDGTSFVTVSTLNCTITGVLLACPGFSVTLN